MILAEFFLGNLLMQWQSSGSTLLNYTNTPSVLTAIFQGPWLASIILEFIRGKSDGGAGSN